MDRHLIQENKWLATGLARMLLIFLHICYYVENLTQNKKKKSEKNETNNVVTIRMLRKKICKVPASEIWEQYDWSVL